MADTKVQLYQRRWYLKHRKEHIERTRLRRKLYKSQLRQYLTKFYKTHPCEHCGIDNPVVLEFHHKDPKEKKIEIGYLKSGSWSVDYLKREISKCQVLCANCHRIETSRVQGWFKAIQ